MRVTSWDPSRCSTFYEWEELFPQAGFFLVRVDVYGGESRRYRNWLIVEQDGQRHTAETFDRLLAANGVTEITDENRELVAKAFALMTIGDYLEGGVVFTDWIEGDWPAMTGSFNYALVGWTEIQGLGVSWGFVFHDGSLKEAEGPFITESHAGEYIDVSFDILPLPSSQGYIWR